MHESWHFMNRRAGWRVKEKGMYVHTQIQGRPGVTGLKSVLLVLTGGFSNKAFLDLEWWINAFYTDHTAQAQTCSCKCP